MEVTKASLEKLRVLQPELVYGENQLSGCFHLSATTSKRNFKNRCPDTVFLYSWDVQNLPNDSCFIYDYFYIDAHWEYCNGVLYIVAYETNGKIEKWSKKIPSEYCHLNSDGSLCLATSSDMISLQRQYQCFSEFFNIIVSQYFYQIAFLNKYEREPWEADRHGLFRALEMACDDNPLPDKKEEIVMLMCLDSDKSKNLLRRTRHEKIKGSSMCPFCKENGHTRKSKECNAHKKQIKGYNKIISTIKTNVNLALL